MMEGDEFLKQRGKGKEDGGYSGSKTEAWEEARRVRGRRDGLGREAGDGETGQENEKNRCMRETGV